jgi:predicted secreted protein
MATNSTDLKLYVGGVAVACATGATLAFTHTTREVLCKDTLAWTDRLPGMRSWSVSGTGLHSIGATQGGDDLMQLGIDREIFIVKMATSASGDVYWEGSGYFSDVSLESPGAEENCTYSFTIDGTGPLGSGVN